MMNIDLEIGALFLYQFSQSAGNFIGGQRETFEGKSAVVTSALPLSNQEKKVIEKDILNRAKGDPEIAFEVDPKLLGGLTIKIDDKIYDHSVSSQLSSMSGLLN